MRLFSRSLTFTYFFMALGMNTISASANVVHSLKAAVTQSTEATAQPVDGEQSPLARKDVQAFIDHMVTSYHFNRDKLSQIFAQVHLRPRIIKTIHNPKEATPWFKYKRIFLTSNRIDAGVAFWQAHQDKLAEAEKTYGVPAHVILGILGVETFYGTRAGKHNALDALATLAFNYPERSKFFTSELESLFILSREQHFDPLVLKSSYAGALGFPQFMPSSYRDYAVDFSNDGIADLLNNPEDAIGSVANYLNRRGHWQANQPVAIKAHLRGEISDQLISGKKILSMEQWAHNGITPEQTLAADVKAGAFQLQEDHETQTWLGLHNFKAILSYNPRINYAMAVYSLGEAIKQARDESLKTAQSSHLSSGKPHV